MQGKKKGTSFWLLCVALIALQLFVCGRLGFARQHFFTDETFSYGLANSEDYAFLNADTAAAHSGAEGWLSSDYFTNYVEYRAGTPFSLHAPFANQAQDVHPPLYYCLLHSVCALFPDSYTAVPGTLLNMVILVALDILLFYVAYFLLKSRWYALVATAFWGFSAAGLSNAVYIRMYLLQTLEIVALVALHAWVLAHARRMTLRYWLAFALMTAAGGLTHYYFYCFAAVLGGICCLALCLHRRWRDCLAYATALLGGVALALAVFPATLQHLVGYRGAYALDSLGGVQVDKFMDYVAYIRKSFFGDHLKIWVLLFGLLFLWWGISRYLLHRQLTLQQKGKGGWPLVWQPVKAVGAEERADARVRTALFGAVCLATAAFLYFCIQGSSIISNRYIYPAYPFIALAFVWLWQKLVPLPRPEWLAAGCAALVCLALCALSLQDYGVDWTYPDYPEAIRQVAEMEQTPDCLLMESEGHWADVYLYTDLLLRMDETRYTAPEELPQAARWLAARNTPQNPVMVVYLNFPAFAEEEQQAQLQQLLESTDYTDYTLVYQYELARAYLLR